MSSFDSTPATVTIYFLFTLWVALFMLNKAITHNFQQYVFIQPIVNTRKLLHSIKPQTLSTISNKFLTIQEILKLRNTCKYFQILLLPNDKNMVMFCKDFGSKEMENVPLMWFDVNFLFFVFFCVLRKPWPFKKEIQKSIQVAYCFK